MLGYGHRYQVGDRLAFGGRVIVVREVHPTHVMYEVEGYHVKTLFRAYRSELVNGEARPLDRESEER
jgi:hypothetical protein